MPVTVQETSTAFTHTIKMVSGQSTPPLKITDSSNSVVFQVSSAGVITGTIAQANVSGLTTASTPTFAGVTISGTPSASTDVATVGYVQTYVNGLSWKQACRVASTANIASLSGLLTVDGVTVSAGDRVLVKNQSTASQNGIYVAASGSWTRAGDFSTAAESVENIAVFVGEGSTQADTQWTLTTNTPYTIGSTSLAFSQIGAGTSYSADGTSLTLTSTTFSINTSWAGQAAIVTVGSLTSGYRKITSPAYASSLTVAGNYVEHLVNVGTLTGPMNIEAPTSPADGNILVFRFLQDGSGTHTVTWDAAFQGSDLDGVDGGTVSTNADTRTVVRFQYCAATATWLILNVQTFSPPGPP